jgi:hypothetical protein
MRATGRLLANFAFLFALAIWGGMVVFFTFITTPIVFDTLDRDLAAGLLGELFPRYFQLQIICSAVALAFVAGRLLFGAPPRGVTIAAAVLLTVALGIGLYNAFAVQPELAAAQARVGSFVTTPRDDPTRLAYGRLHGRAMILNGLAALLGGATLALAAYNPALLTRRDERAVITVATATDGANREVRGRGTKELAGG